MPESRLDDVTPSEDPGRGIGGGSEPEHDRDSREADERDLDEVTPSDDPGIGSPDPDTDTSTDDSERADERDLDDVTPSDDPGIDTPTRRREIPDTADERELDEVTAGDDPGRGIGREGRRGPDRQAGDRLDSDDRELVDEVAEQTDLRREQIRRVEETDDGRLRPILTDEAAEAFARERVVTERERQRREADVDAVGPLDRFDIDELEFGVTDEGIDISPTEDALREEAISRVARREDQFDEEDLFAETTDERIEVRVQEDALIREFRQEAAAEIGVSPDEVEIEEDDGQLRASAEVSTAEPQTRQQQFLDFATGGLTREVRERELDAERGGEEEFIRGIAEDIDPDRDLPSEGDVLPGVPDSGRAGLLAAGAGAAVAAPEPVTTGTGAAVLGGLVLGGIAIDTARRSELDISEEQVEEVEIAGPALSGELEVTDGARSELEVQEADRFEIDPADIHVTDEGEIQITEGDLTADTRQVVAGTRLQEEAEEEQFEEAEDFDQPMPSIPEEFIPEDDTVIGERIGEPVEDTRDEIQIPDEIQQPEDQLSEEELQQVVEQREFEQFDESATETLDDDIGFDELAEQTTEIFEPTDVLVDDVGTDRVVPISVVDDRTTLDEVSDAAADVEITADQALQDSDVALDMVSQTAADTAGVEAMGTGAASGLGAFESLLSTPTAPGTGIGTGGSSPATPTEPTVPPIPLDTDSGDDDVDDLLNFDERRRERELPDPLEDLGDVDGGFEDLEDIDVLEGF